jgi:mannose/cellobiose epimerase-like protein (N-acyl-D-glucosamine 2-epimerase family)
MTTFVRSIPARQPTDAAQWADWFHDAFLPDWIERVRDKANGGFFDTLDQHGNPVSNAPKTVLAQARLAFTFAHLADLSGDARFDAAASDAFSGLPRFRKSSGLYCRALTPDGSATGKPGDGVARSYDQSFVILALATWLRRRPSPEFEAELDNCWAAIETHLCDPAAGLLLEDDSVSDPGHPDAPMWAQNPHMHLYEAALQAFEMTGRPEWLDRASALRAVALRHFFDKASGTIVEFLAPDLSPLAGEPGARREVGHQCEWAWLLRREMALGGREDLSDVVSRLEGFALTRGFATSGVMRGAAFDAVNAEGGLLEETFLLWPQTEAIKMFAVRHMAGATGAGDAAVELMVLMFERYFRDRPVFINQLNAAGRAIWPEALSRLLYHIVLALTEGARAGLWPGPTR